jgi:dTDP-4-dehydrorhamnose reductase
MNKIVVLGNGYIGKKAYKYFLENLENIYDVVHLANYPYNTPDKLKETLFSNLISEFRGSQTKWIINCVGYTGAPNVDACEENKQICWDLNVTLPTMLAQFCVKDNIKIINVSSGCIYDGPTDVQYTEEDEPNFGLTNPDSSWYSKTKHAAELCLKNFKNVYTLRIRMPICNDFNSKKNYLSKILKYNNILEEVNSKTVIEDLLHVINKIINIEELPNGVYNCVNPNPLKTTEVCDILDKHGLWNPNWKFITYNQLKEHIVANRSNCILSIDKVKEYGLDMPSERESLIRILSEKETYLTKELADER